MIQHLFAAIVAFFFSSLFVLLCTFSPSPICLCVVEKPKCFSFDDENVENLVVCYKHMDAHVQCALFPKTQSIWRLRKPKYHGPSVQISWNVVLFNAFILINRQISIILLSLKTAPRYTIRKLRIYFVLVKNHGHLLLLLTKCPTVIYWNDLMFELKLPVFSLVFCFVESEL